MRDIILASASPRRRELMEQIGLSFTVIPAQGEEFTTRTRPDEVVKELSYQKAKEVYDKSDKRSIVIGSDTVVSIDDILLGKPANAEEWRDMIKTLRGNAHKVYTGVTIMWKGDDHTSHVLCFAEDTKVYVHNISDEEIDEYIALGEDIDKAGGYGIQGSFAKFIDKIDGDYNNVVGLPVAKLYQELKKSGLI